MAQRGSIKKGEIRNPKGRTPGTPNKSNLVLEELQKQGFNLIQAMVMVAKTEPAEHDERYIQLLEIRDKNRFKLLERISPALKMIDHNLDATKPITINFDFSDPKTRK